MRKLSKKIAKMANKNRESKKSKRSKKNKEKDSDSVGEISMATTSSGSISSADDGPGLLRALSMLSDPQTGGDVAAAAESICKLCTWVAD